MFAFLWNLNMKTCSVTMLAFVLLPALAAGSTFFAIDPSGRCAEECYVTGYHSVGWSTLPLATYLDQCHWSPTLFSYDYESLADDKTPPTSIKACVEFGDGISKATAIPQFFNLPTTAQIDIEISYISTEDTTNVIPEQAITAGLAIQDSLLQQSIYKNSSGTGNIIHAQYGDSFLGVYIGANFSASEFAASVLQRFITHIKVSGIGKTLQYQRCGTQPTPATTFGIIADTSSGIEALLNVQTAVTRWSKGKCNEDFLATMSSSAQANKKNPTKAPLDQGASLNRTSWANYTSKNDDMGNQALPGPLYSILFASEAQAECRTIEVEQGTDCGKLAVKCGVSGFDFEGFNKINNFCSTLEAGQRVCCSRGELPDLRLKPDSEGFCAVYTVIKDDTCRGIAIRHGLTVRELESLNQQTWGWSGCDLPDKLYPNTRLCVSGGAPPFPIANPLAVCGPTKLGTKRPPWFIKSSEWGSLNPCPLKSCCNVWGNCGTTADFCVEQSLGRPGTSKSQNGCIGNCGMAIMNNKSPPRQFISVGYFEAWNDNRPCVRMDVDEIPRGAYSHVHFAFADISTNYEVSISRFQGQFEKFKKSSGFKRILAFGGWDFSTKPATYAVFRNGVKPENREVFATNLASFILQHGLDGIDIDWEYPGVPDMDWLPRSSPEEGPNYAKFLKLLRSKLLDKSISIAAPASFWYLKAYPIEEIAKTVNYIVFMTYDLHGQWDWGNKWAVSGCKNGDCLRSHVDLMETYNSLAMITKAGVSAEKVIVGVTSYGRQFRMTDPNCSGKHCTFSGPISTAPAGRCTKTPEFLSNAEIKEIILKNPSAKVISNSDFSKTLIYDGNIWVSWMDDEDKLKRTALYRSLNFGGVIDWAISLNTFGNTELDDSDSLINDAKSYGLRRAPPSLQMNDFSCQMDESWRSQDCMNPGVTQNEASASWRWNQVKAPAAWCAAITHWTLKRGNTQTSGRLSFPTVLSNFFNYTLLYRCEILTKNTDGNGCVSPQECRGPNKGSAAAMQYILSALSRVNLFFIALRDSVQDVQIESVSPMNDFKRNFIGKPDKTLEILFDFLSMAIAMGSATFFNTWLKSIPLSEVMKPTITAATPNLKDYTKEAAMFGMNTAKSAIKDMQSKANLKLPDRIDDTFHQLVKVWKSAIERANAAMFSGDDASLRMLTSLLEDGAVFRLDPLEPKQLLPHARRLLYSILIIQTWRMQGFWPVLVDTGAKCRQTGVGIDEWVAKRDLQGLARICREEDGKQYHMLAVKGVYDCYVNTVGGSTMTRICNKKLVVPPGLQKIRDGPVSDWGDLSIYTMLESAGRGFDLWNGNHKFKEADFDNEETMKNLINAVGDFNVASIPGIIDIPICAWKEIQNNWEHGTGDNYPCN